MSLNKHITIGWQLLQHILVYTKEWIIGVNLQVYYKKYLWLIMTPTGINGDATVCKASCKL